MTLLFIFDMDDVLYDYDWRARMAGMTQLTGHSLSELRNLWWHDQGERAAETGEFASVESYYEAFLAAMGTTIDEDDWVRVRAGAMTPRPAALETVRRASELGQVTLLTNNGPLAHKHLRTLAPELVELFGDHLFASSYYGARKPDPVVFERVLAKYGVEAENAFFADDMSINVDGARSIGITGYHVGTSEGMREAVESFAAARAASA
ncbi:MAG: HAD family hydrolase [Microbacteriaceae bacterium]